MSSTTATTVPTKTTITVKDWIKQHQLLTFFVMSYALIFAATFSSMWFNIPFIGVPWFLAVFSPTISALAISAITGGMPAVKQLLQGYTRWKVGGRWYLGALSLLLIPLAVALIYKALGNEFPRISPGSNGCFFAGPINLQFLFGTFL